MKLLLVALTVFLSILAISPAFAWGSDCEYSREIRREVNLGASRQLNVIAGAGVLEIKGDEGRATVLIEAKLCAKSESILADMTVGSQLDDDVMHLKTEFANRGFWGTDSEGAHIDLIVYVPHDVELDVVDSSGKASVEGVGSLAMIDSSGELIINGVSGDVRIKDSSGELKINNVVGSVWVTDGSGAIKVRAIAGNLTVESDGSGAIMVERVKGKVLVNADGSGSIDVVDVGGSFTVKNDSSGGIHHQNIAGDVRLPN